ncbi:hypothetical protein NGB36_16280 [Streptomyces sp. RB6PN25]|uniref:Squalene cyclase C-terminal domain-containing protein n=1 Tax=Streptomyces humicola TaxID=2953240 RepID=A0ABT1PWR8_9ACTN|nr:prenyltransferase/squalene oxidase repeat-containing protein [Streptomyces humicola]MCQ4082123.1 hypothetical protein [Streptomyces humicola]
MALRTAMTSTAAALAAAALTVTATAPAAASSSPSPATSSSDVPAALYGSSDPTYDGVWRQSTALLALRTAGVTPADEATAWLVDQQCANGAFPSYRASRTTPCDAQNEDVDSTALAVQALAALGGHTTAVRQAMDWLAEVQNTDGGWGYQPDQPSDANSTAVVIGALAAAGGDITQTTKGGKSPYNALLSFQLGCTATASQRGAFAYRPDSSGHLAANAKATADAAFAALGKGYVVTAPQSNTDPKPMDCSATAGSATAPLNPALAADAASAYLATALSAGGEHLSSAQPGSDQQTPDYGTTTDAVIALAADGHPVAAKKAYTWLTKNAGTWAKDNPAALGSLVLAARATGADPRDFAGADLVQQLENTGPRPRSAVSSDPAQVRRQSSAGGGTVWWVIGAGLVAGIGIGLAFSFMRGSGRRNGKK